MKDKIVRFDVGDLLPIGLTLLVAGIGIVYGLSVMSDVNDEFCEGVYHGGHCYTDSNYNVSYNVDADFNASVKATEGISKIPEKMPLIATVIVAAVIIGILVRYLVVRYN